MIDPLSDVFDQVEVRGFVTGGFATRGPWVTRGQLSRPFKLLVLVAGTVTVTVDGHDPATMSPGDVVLLNHRRSLVVRGGPAEETPVELDPEPAFDAAALTAADRSLDDVMVGGRIDVSPAGQRLLGSALPGLVHVRAAGTGVGRLTGLVDRLLDEALSDRPGSAFAMRQHAQLLLLEVLRAWLDQEQPADGWLRLLADEQLAPALRLIHGQPGERWGLLELARAAGMSRTAFAERFRALAGTPPLTYLSQWRMVLAQRALRDPDVRVGQLAAELGYGSDSAFSTAFKRELGESPARFRQRQR